jgi:hypothetical protein
VRAVAGVRQEVLKAGEMLNRAPIFLFCLTGGGSNILWNMFASHPDACLPLYETHEIFRGGLRAGTWAGYRVALFSGQPRLFDRWNLAPRKPIRESTKRFIDRTFYESKLLTLTDRHMRFKHEDELYTWKEVSAARLVTKNKNGLAFMSDTFQSMYPDSVFFALVRHPLPLYQNHQVRKNTKNKTKSPEIFADWYNRIVSRIIADSGRIINYHIVKFEHLLADPMEMIQILYGLAELDFSKFKAVRIRAKPRLMADGSIGTTLPAFGHYWFDLAKIHDILDPEINRYQMQRVAAGERERIMELTRAACQQLDYD